MQRVDLSPMEQALSIARLNEQFSMSLHDIASRLGKAHTTIVNTVRLLQLPEFARKALEQGKISEGHARAVLALKDRESVQKYLVDAIGKEGWSVRQAESYVKQQKSSKIKVSTVKKSDKKLELDALKLQKTYGGNVKITSQKNSVSVNFKFKTNKEYTQFLGKITD